jgi:tetratricopeptide (TPR) repeat protein
VPEILILISLSIIFIIILRKIPEVDEGEMNTHTVSDDLNFNGNNNKVLETRLDAALLSKNYDESEKLCLELITSDPKNGEYYARLGSLYLSCQNFSDAKDAFLEATKFNSRNGLWYNNLGLAFFNLKQFGKAINAYEKAIEIDAKVAGRYINLGLVYLNLGNKKKAREYFQKAVELEPSNTKYRALFAKTEGVKV